LTSFGGDQRVEKLSETLRIAENNINETVAAIRETRKKIRNDEYFQDTEEIFAMKKYLPKTIFEKLHNELGEFLEKSQRSKNYDLSAETLKAYADDLAKKAETDLRQNEQLGREISKTKAAIYRQEKENKKNQEKINLGLKEREDLHFKIRNHKRLTGKNMYDLSQELKQIRQKITDIKSEKIGTTIESLLKSIDSRLEDEEKKLSTLLSKIYDYNFCDEQQAILSQPSILKLMEKQYEDGKKMEMFLRIKMREDDGKLKERQNYLSNLRKQVKILAGDKDLDPFSN